MAGYIRAYAKVDNKIYFSVNSKALVTSTKLYEAPAIKLARGTSKAVVTWNLLDGADGYEIYMATGEKNTNFKKVGTVNASTKTFTKTGLTKNQYYNFKVRGFIKCSDGSCVYGNFSDVKYIIAR